MKFKCPKCEEPGISWFTYFADDLKKTNRCEICDAKIGRRHYLTHFALEMIIGGGIAVLVAFFLLQHRYGASGKWILILGVFGFFTVLRLIELAFTRLEDLDSEKALKIDRRNKKIEKVYLGFLLLLIALGIYTAITM